jgi:hypothetical protein
MIAMAVLLVALASVNLGQALEGPPSDGASSPETHWIGRRFVVLRSYRRLSRRNATMITSTTTTMTIGMPMDALTISMPSFRDSIRTIPVRPLLGLRTAARV